MSAYLIKRFLALFSKSFWVMVFCSVIYNLCTAECKTIYHNYCPTVFALHINFFAVHIL